MVSPTPSNITQVRQRGMSDQDYIPRAVEYISQTWPYWNRTQGARHFAIHVGRCGVLECAWLRALALISLCVAGVCVCVSQLCGRWMCVASHSVCGAGVTSGPRLMQHVASTLLVLRASHDSLAGDTGVQEASEYARQVATNITWLTHWGLTK